MRIILFTIAVLLFAMPASANDFWSECGGSSSIGTQPKVSGVGCIEFAFTSATTAAQVFRVQNNFAVVKVDPNVASTGIATAEVMVQSCLRGYTPSANTCSDILNSTLNGLAGAVGTQRTDVRIPYGVYRLVFTVPISGGETGSVQVHGEN